MKIILDTNLFTPGKDLWSKSLKKSKTLLNEGGNFGTIYNYCPRLLLLTPTIKTEIISQLSQFKNKVNKEESDGLWDSSICKIVVNKIEDTLKIVNGLSCSKIEVGISTSFWHNMIGTVKGKDIKDWIIANEIKLIKSSGVEATFLTHNDKDFEDFKIQNPDFEMILKSEANAKVQEIITEDLRKHICDSFFKKDFSLADGLVENSNIENVISLIDSINKLFWINGITQIGKTGLELPKIKNKNADFIVSLSFKEEILKSQNITVVKPNSVIVFMKIQVKNYKLIINSLNYNPDLKLNSND